MRLRNVEFDDNENPVTATVDLSLDELALLYAFVGNAAPNNVNDEFGHKWGEVLRELAEGVSGGFFNRFYDAGWHEVMPRSRGVKVAVTHE